MSTTLCRHSYIRPPTVGSTSVKASSTQLRQAAPCSPRRQGLCWYRIRGGFSTWPRRHRHPISPLATRPPSTCHAVDCPASSMESPGLWPPPSPHQPVHHRQHSRRASYRQPVRGFARTLDMPVHIRAHLACHHNNLSYSVIFHLYRLHITYHRQPLDHYG